MDTSTVVGIAISLFSVLISILFAITAFYFSNQSNKTLEHIQTKIDQQEKIVNLLELVLLNYHEQMQARKKGSTSKESSEEELEQAIQEVRHLIFDPASVKLKKSKLGET